MCIFSIYLYNCFDNYHILGTLPVYGYTENKVNKWMNESTTNDWKLCSEQIWKQEEWNKWAVEIVII